MVSADKKKKKQLDFPTENMLDSRTENKMPVWNQCCQL